jgi:hypothetical protein
MAGREEEWGSLVRWHTGFHDALTKAAHNQYLEWAGLAIRAELFLPVERAMSEHRVTEIEARPRRDPVGGPRARP